MLKRFQLVRKLLRQAVFIQWLGFRDALTILQHPHHRILVNEGIRADLSVWQDFLAAFNGLSVWREEHRLEVELLINCDAAGSSRFGVYYRGFWCVGSAPRTGFRLAGQEI